MCDNRDTVGVMSDILAVKLHNVCVVIKGGYDVMYSAHDGIHMPPVMSYIVGVMYSIDWV